MKLPPEFVSTITNTFGEDGKRFLADLPALINEASARWGLTDIQPVSNLSYNFVCYALSGASDSERSRSAEVVLKIGVPRDELTSEIAALRLFNGEGACRLFDTDEEKGFLLLERLHPGVMLAALEDDDAATHIAAEGMKRLWKPLEHVTLSASEGSRTQPERLSPALPGTCARGKCAPGASVGRDQRSLRVRQEQFILLSDWFDGLKRLREMFNGGTGPLDERLVERVERSTQDFFGENHMPVLMHGDFHHFNILSSERGWLAIDPKGVIGPAAYEVGPLMLNPWGSLSDGINTQQILKRRVGILHEHLGFERERLLDWSLAHAILSAWWGIEDNTGWDYAMMFAGMLAGFK